MTSWDELDEIEYDNTGYIPVKGRERIEKIASQNSYPSFLLESYIMEYLNCRRFVRNRNNLLLMIDFDLVSEERIIKAIQRTFWITIGNFLLFDNVHPRDLKNRILYSLVGSPISNLESGVFLEGLASPFAFPFNFNDIDIVDPLLTLNDRFVVFDNGKIYQWKFADIAKSTVYDNQSTFVSEEIDLVPFEVSVNTFRIFYSERPPDIQRLNFELSRLIEQRREILAQLKDLHNIRKLTISFKSDNALEPPRLGRFDYAKRSDDGYKISTDLAPIYYRSALQHIKSAKLQQQKNGLNDELLYETIPAIICSYLCLDSHINELGHHLLIPNWQEIVEKSIESKIGHISNKITGINLLKEKPYLRRDVEKLVNLRDKLIHYKFPSYAPIKTNTDIVSQLYVEVGLENTIQYISIVSRIITALHSHLGGLYRATWLKPAPGWLQDDLDPLVLLKL